MASAWQFRCSSYAGRSYSVCGADVVVLCWLSIDVIPYSVDRVMPGVWTGRAAYGHDCSHMVKDRKLGPAR